VSLRAAVVGLGAMGRHHARHLATTQPDVELVACCDADERRAAEHAGQWGAQPLADASSLPEALDVAVVAVPTTAHLAVAEPLLRRGVHCLVEKPIAASLDEADALIEAAREGGALLAVGHAERFNPGLMRVRDLIEEPRFVEADRLGVFPERSLDVDVVLDLMIHDLDLLCWLTRSEPVDVQAIGIDVLTPRVDIANARITYGSGCTADVTASRVSAEITRKMRVFDRDRYLSVDFVAQSAEVVSLGPGRGRPTIERRSLGPERPEDREEPLYHQMTSFLAAVRGEPSATVSGVEGRRALGGALAVLRAMETQRRRAEELRGRHAGGVP
jgi:predicted dehydrogenase